MAGPERHVWRTVVEKNPDHPRAYAQRWRDLAAEGRDLAPYGRIVAGFGTARGYDLGDFDRDVVSAGLREAQRFAGWRAETWDEDADFLVAVLERA